MSIRSPNHLKAYYIRGSSSIRLLRKSQHSLSADAVIPSVMSDFFFLGSGFIVNFIIRETNDEKHSRLDKVNW